ncbi:MAG: hypothetical protein EOP88_11725 [Verrucomicrobiaceae bacterium]|nr:MAG: hypothetical protein EOP88_11725 [Verrucomicrobiaceae bacterium]
MSFSQSSRLLRSASRLTGAAACLLPALLLAHPGHYHPDETDEFDFFRATLFHTHGSLDYVLAAVAIVSMVLACMSGKPAVRITAMIASLGSIALLPIL